MKSSVLKQITELPDLTFAQLKERWKDLYGTDAPAYNKSFLIKRLAYRIQELAYGGLSEKARTQLRDAGKNDTDGQTSRMERRKGKVGMPVPGTRLVREWKGRRYEVTVVREGFEFEGSPYRSLTAVTKVITGSQWNGPSFFGLRKKRGKANQ